eukprot:5413514-Alexandrium_andersonii.AAC.2
MAPQAVSLLVLARPCSLRCVVHPGCSVTTVGALAHRQSSSTVAQAQALHADRSLGPLGRYVRVARTASAALREGCQCLWGVGFRALTVAPPAAGARIRLVCLVWPSVRVCPDASFAVLSELPLRSVCNLRRSSRVKPSLTHTWCNPAFVWYLQAAHAAP